MNQEKLVEELREGHAWKYADGPVYSQGTKYSDKSKATDLELLKAASTCHNCNRSATSEEVQEAIEFAHDYDSFSNEILRYIEHASDCDFYEDSDEYQED